MFEQDEPLPDECPAGGPNSALEVLQRLRDSYRGIPQCGSLVDGTVLAAVEITLNRLARASYRL